MHPLRLCESSPEPAPRAYHTLVELGGYLVLFGGRGRQGLLSGSEALAAFDTATKCWTLIGTAPHVCALMSGFAETHSSIWLGPCAV